MFHREDESDGMIDADYERSGGSDGVRAEYRIEPDEIRRAMERQGAEQRKRAEIMIIESIVHGTAGRRTTEGEAG